MELSADVDRGASIDGQCHSGYELGFVGGEEEGGAGDVPGGPHAVAEWDAGVADTTGYAVRLVIPVEDRRGMLAAISSCISEIETNITRLDARTGDAQLARI